MAGDLKGLFRGHLRTLFDAGTTTGLTDGQLLERFATRRDAGSELAFAALVERHGPMVLRACRGILRDDHEAMDAFQATFLVLARKGGSLWVRDSLGPWLHRVACHAAGRAKSTAARRRASEKKAVEMAEPRNVGEDREELASVIHEEVDRLPERYRSAVVLCDLEGRTCEEAARHLGCPIGTVGSRLARGRQRLRDRLSRRGLAPRGGLASGTVAWRGPREPIPPQLVGSTADVAARFVSIQAVPQGPAARLALGVLRSMAMTRWWKVASVLLALSASTSGVVALAGRGAVVAEARPDDVLKAAQPDGAVFIEVKPGTLRVVVEERGILEASRNSEVFCMVEGQSTITSIVPEYDRVTKGQVVCELDSTSLNDDLTHQVIAVKNAEAALDDARLTREGAEIAVQEYLDEVYPKDSLAALSEIARARSSITSAEERLKRTRTALERLNAMLAGQGGTKTPADLVATLDLEDRLGAADQALDQGRRALEIGLAKRDLLEKFTRDKTVKQLRIAVDRTRPVELARQASCEIEKAKEAHLRRQIASCKILAPADGYLNYANLPNPSGARPRPRIEEGAAIRERQTWLSDVLQESLMAKKERTFTHGFTILKGGVPQQDRSPHGGPPHGSAYPQPRYTGRVVLRLLPPSSLPDLPIAPRRLDRLHRPAHHQRGLAGHRLGREAASRYGLRRLRVRRLGVGRLGHCLGHSDPEPSRSRRRCLDRRR